MNLYTYKYRIKDSSSRRKLIELASKVNHIWNYINELNIESYKDYKSGKKSNAFLSEYDFNNLLTGSSKKIKLHSDSIQETSRFFVSARNNTNKKFNLNFRSYKRNLGWIPFKGRSISLKDDEIIFMKKKLRFYKSRPIPSDAKIKTGSFNQNSKGFWFFSITFTSESLDSKIPNHKNPNEIIGIDLGIKNLMTLSDGKTESIKNYTKIYKNKLASAQRAGKKKLVKNIHIKIKNSRDNELHQITTKLAKEYGNIAVGNVSSQNIIDKNISSNMTSAVYNSGWFKVKSFLKYKAKKLGGFYEEVEEAYSSQTCSVCSKRTGPKGQSGLNIRDWTCHLCQAKHDRDVNAAKNIAKRFVENNNLVIVTNDNDYSKDKNKILIESKSYSVLDIIRR